jgi:hypothetical protein
MTIRFFVIYNAGRESMPYNTVPVFGYASHFHYSFQNSILHTTHVWKIPLQIQIQINTIRTAVVFDINHH